MTTRADVDRLSAASSRLVALARTDLARAVDLADVSSPEAVRDMLLEVVPALVREYGDLAAVVAAEWYEQTRAAQVSGRYTAQVGGLADEAAVQGSVRYAAGHLFDDEPDRTLAILNGALQRYVYHSVRDTVARNVARDPARPRFARVPQGAVTCAFCTMLASRGFVYLTRESAGATREWHDDCDCQVVPEWDAQTHHIAGYDPERLYALYRDGVREAGTTTDVNAVLAAMRRANPGAFTDGVYATP